MLHNNTLYTSRSAIEDMQRCPRKRYLAWELEGRGVSSRFLSAPLTTGTLVHEAVAKILLFPNTELDPLIKYTTERYSELHKQSEGFNDVPEAGQDFVFGEQIALTEALIRIWYLREYPALCSTYKIIDVEKEIVQELAPGIVFQSRADAILKTRAQPSDLYIYSLKTQAQWTQYDEESYAEALQNLTEAWALDQLLAARHHTISTLADHLTQTLISPQVLNSDIEVLHYIKSLEGLPKEVFGIRYCFLVKGKRFFDEEKGFKTTRSPLISGWRRHVQGSWEYAHSWKYPNPHNKSGFSSLGKGWELFNVWEDDKWTIESWIDALNQQMVQSTCGDIIARHVVRPPEYYKSASNVGSAITQVRAQEAKIHQALSNYEKYLERERVEDLSEDLKEFLDVNFIQHRHSCKYPIKCSMYKVCFRGVDPLGPEFKSREPHHEKEREIAHDN